MSDRAAFLIAWCLGIEALLVLAFLRDDVARLAAVFAATMAVGMILAVLML